MSELKSFNTEEFLANRKLLTRKEQSVLWVLFYNDDNPLTAKEILNIIIDKMSDWITSDKDKNSMIVSSFVKEQINLIDKKKYSELAQKILDIKDSSEASSIKINKLQKLLTRYKIQKISFPTIVKILSNLCKAGFVISKEAESKREKYYYALNPNIYEQLNKLIVVEAKLRKL